MKLETLTSKEQSVIAALRDEHLTSSEILNKTQEIPHILKLYSILDKLRSEGMVESYMKRGIKYHYAA